ncbi:MAG: hypothetical protein EOP49_13450 [Sphingobacteriales bacterium]|nr:MAG: hypothetical protein EOP49_13450 [Sphingobacteriales bacterium]
MVNKKYLLLAGLCSVLAVQPLRAQESETATASWSGRDMTYRGENYDVLDSSYYSGKRLDQYRRYMNHQTVYPPKPNNMWEIGINAGLANVFGDVTSKTPFTAKKATDAIGFGLTVRKALGYFLSMRFQYIHATTTGMDYRTHTPNERPWSQLGYTSGIYNNYRTPINEFTLQLVGAINNIRFHKGKNTMSLYGLLGGGVMTYRAKINALDANGNPYQFAPDPITGSAGVPFYATGAEWTDRKDVYDYLENLMDDSYESDPVKDSHKGSGTKNYIPVLTTGLGIQFRLGERVTLQLEDKVSYTGRDLLDGTQLQNNGSLTSENDLFNYASIGLNFNLGNKRKNVAPLWWVNPLDHAYSELSDPRHMRLPEPILPDADGDGIADQFDKCPGTPAGVAVDSHGCPMDTDGDGVPDFRDKQLITPTECQPVDADGVGKCPCPDGCGQVTGCNISNGNLNFSGSSSTLSTGMRNQLSTLASQMQAAPNCKVVIIGNGSGSKVQQQRSWDRVNAVISHMSDTHGIDRNRFIFQYGGTGDENTVTFRAANSGEEGPSNVAPPFPNLRKD